MYILLVWINQHFGCWFSKIMQLCESWTFRIQIAKLRYFCNEVRWVFDSDSLLQAADTVSRYWRNRWNTIFAGLPSDFPEDDVLLGIRRPGAGHRNSSGRDQVSLTWTGPPLRCHALPSKWTEGVIHLIIVVDPLPRYQIFRPAHFDQFRQLLLIGHRLIANGCGFRWSWFVWIALNGFVILCRFAAFILRASWVKVSGIVG